MKRFLSVLLAALLLVAMAVPAMAEEKPTISYYAYWCGSLDPDSYCETYVEDALGVDIQIKKVSHTDSEAVNLMLGSGEMPDCGWFGKSATYMEDQELVRSIPVDLVKEYAPSLIEYCDENPIVYAICLDPEDETQFRCLPDLYDTYTEMYVYCLYLRYDWIQNLNIDLGVNVEQVADRLYVADKGLSLDVFRAVLDGFVNGDPDGNGQNDTFGYLKDYTQFLSAYGIIDSNMEVDGKPCEWYTNPKLKEMLTDLAEMYKDGLIYQEIFTIGWGEDWEIINTNSAGVWASSTNSLNSWASNRPPLTLLNNEDSEATLLMIPGIADDEGHTYRSAYTSAVGGERFFVNADVDDEKLVEILKFYEWCNFNDDPTVQATLWYGEEGVDWEWNEDKTAPVKISEIINGERGSQVFIRNTQLGKIWEWITFEPYFSAGAKYYVQNEGGIWNEDMIQRYKYDIYSETEASEISNEYSGDWQNTRDAYFMAVITGEKNVEEDWDAYIQELNDLNYDEYLAELDKAPSVEEIIAQFAK